MTIPFTLRCTGKRKCRDGFYLLVNGQRLWFKNRAAAVGSAVAILHLQRMQVLTVREYAKQKKVIKQLPPGARSHVKSTGALHWFEAEKSPTIQSGPPNQNASNAKLEGQI